MTVNDQLKSSTYRGVRFLYQGSTESSGFKTAEHLYPGSDNFRLEQLGKAPRKFNIQAKVEFENRDRLDAALNTSGSGILVHPLYGNFLVKVTEYTKNDNKDDLGFFSYNIQFVVEIGLIVPSISTIATSVISRGRSTYIGVASTLLRSSLSRIGF